MFVDLTGMAQALLFDGMLCCPAQRIAIIGRVSGGFHRTFDKELREWSPRGQSPQGCRFLGDARGKQRGLSVLGEVFP